MPDQNLGVQSNVKRFDLLEIRASLNSRLLAFALAESNQPNVLEVFSLFAALQKSTHQVEALWAHKICDYEVGKGCS